MNLFRTRKYTKALTALMLTVCLFFCGLTVSRADELSGLNTERRHTVCTELSEAAKSYYSGSFSAENLLSLQGASDSSNSLNATKDNPLYDALQELMQSTLDRSRLPIYGGYGVNSLAYFWNSTDTSPDVDNSKSSHFLMFYSDAVYEYPGNKVNMNREHIWPKSHASFHEMNGGSDLHHLRPSASAVNDAKSDHIFGYVDEMYTAGFDTGMMNNEEVYKVYADKDVFEPKDDVKGDVARILLYVYCCWGQPNLYSDLDASLLPAGDPDEVTNTGGRVITDLDTLLTWCADDPVDTWEMKRNDLAQLQQGNRNVFIDYPELAWKLFSREVPSGMQTPTHTGCAHSYGEAVLESPTCTEPGTIRQTCTICGNVHTLPTPAAGHVDEDTDNRCDICGTLLLGAYTLTDTLHDGDHVLLYHPASGKAMTPHINSSGRFSAVEVIEAEGVIHPDQETAVFYVEESESGFSFLHNGKYLSTPQKGGKLQWSDTKDACASWNIVQAENGTVYIINAGAVNNYGKTAVEFFNNAFTAYSNPNSEAFGFRLYTSEDHAWEKVSVKEPAVSEPGLISYKCLACGETMTEEIPAIPPVYSCTEGNNSTWEGPDQAALRFVFDRSGDTSAALGHFSALQENGQEILPVSDEGKANYTLDKETAALLLQPEWLSALSQGSHSLTVIFDDGSVDISFTVRIQASSESESEKESSTGESKTEESSAAESSSETSATEESTANTSTEAESTRPESSGKSDPKDKDYTVVVTGDPTPVRMLWILMFGSLILACFCGSVLKRAVDRI